MNTSTTHYWTHINLYTAPNFCLKKKLAKLEVWSSVRFYGDEETRTLDPLLARQVLSQLSYIPMTLSGRQLITHL